MNRMTLFWRTARHLKTRQVVYQIWNRLRRQPELRLHKHSPATYFLTVPEADKPVSRCDGVFTFLNQRVSFPNQIDWNYAENGKLWVYNLNYFDFLNQPNVAPDEGVALIRAFIAQTNVLRDGLEPYPMSLRIINWVQFLSRHQIQDDRVNAHLFAQTQLLSRRLEYHLAGNHLLENGFALLVSALYFRQKTWFHKAAKLIRTELTTQILADGCHDERSPVYHQILLDRLLTVLLAIQHDTWSTQSSPRPFLAQQAASMLTWLNSVTFRNGDVPMVNDAAFDVAPTTAQLRLKAKRITFPDKKQGAQVERVPGSRPSGYRMFHQNRYELLVDVGAIGPNHQPGHAHADTFSFVLYVDNRPVVVDVGTSTYQRGQRRDWERSTAAHNTVEVAQVNSSEVWSAFRVGRRARVMVLKDTETTLTARHNGYWQLGILHQRSWTVEPTKLTITDRLLNVAEETLSGQGGVARFHFQPGIDVRIQGDSVLAGPIRLTCSSLTELRLCVTAYAMAKGFNRLRTGHCLEILFTNTLETTITLANEDSLPDLLL